MSALEPESPEVVGHLGAGVGRPRSASTVGRRSWLRKPRGRWVKAAEGLEERHHPRIAEAQRRDALAGFDGGALQPVERVLGQDAVVTHPFDFEELAIHLWPSSRRYGRLSIAFAHVEIHGVVDRGFRAEGVLLFEILLHVGRLVLDVEARLDPIRDDARAIAKRRWRGRAREAQRKQQADAVGSPEVEILADHRFEEMRPCTGRLKTWVRLTSS